MRPIVVHLTKITPTTTLASAGIAKFIAKTLKCPIADDQSSLKDFWEDSDSCDSIILVNGPPAFCSFREELADAVFHAGTLVFAQNDYTIYPPSQVNKVMRERGWTNEKGHVVPPYTWTTIPRKMRRETDVYVNWNALTFRPPRKRFGRDRSNGLFYFGAYRQGRHETFMKYLSTVGGLTISASAVAGKKFSEHLPEALVVPPRENIIETCSHYRYGLYIHDEYSTKHFCSPANRFYEMLSAGMVIFVAEECVDTLKKAGYDVPPEQVVMTSGDLASRISAMNRSQHKYDWARQRQRKLWFDRAESERKNLPKVLRRAAGRVK